MAFGGSRTHHRIACAIEDAGFEIRDTIMWLYGSGFPKSMNIGQAILKKNIQINKWQGWGTCLKPSFEPIIVARNPLDGTCIDNVIKWGVGGINIDECRVGDELIKGGTMPDFRDIGKKSKESIGIDKLCFGQVNNAERKPLDNHIGRFPANTILTYDEADFEEVCSGFPNTKKNGNITKKYEAHNDIYSKRQIINEFTAYEDSGSASRYFYCAKASKKDRDEGLESFVDKKFFSNLNTKNGSGERLDGGKTPIRKNTHPTVKPTELMQYLVRLVTPKGGIVLDPFMGSGSTGKAVAYENKERQANYSFIGIEKEQEYCDIAKARIEYVNGKIEPIRMNIE